MGHGDPGPCWCFAHSLKAGPGCRHRIPAWRPELGEALATGVPATFFFPSQEIDTPRKVKWPLQGHTAWASQEQKPGFLPRGFLLSLSLCGEQGTDHQDIGGTLYSFQSISSHLACVYQGLRPCPQETLRAIKEIRAREPDKPGSGGPN